MEVDAVEATMTTMATISLEARPIFDGAMGDCVGHTESMEYDHYDSDTLFEFWRGLE
jgi:hypothetical protein